VLFSFFFAIFQTLAPVRHVTVATTTAEPSVKPGASITLFVDITPKPGIHVYAPGATDYLTVTLTVNPPPGVKIGKPAYPKSEPMLFAETKETIPVYNKPFRLTTKATVGKSVKAGGKLIVTGTLRYQACDDQVCFIPESQPVSWTVDAR
jgi:DsbC/DsbD-like thiol-disulfide interchange protein